MTFNLVLVGEMSRLEGQAARAPGKSRALAAASTSSQTAEHSLQSGLISLPAKDSCTLKTLQLLACSASFSLSHCFSQLEELCLSHLDTA